MSTRYTRKGMVYFEKPEAMRSSLQQYETELLPQKYWNLLKVLA